MPRRRRNRVLPDCRLTRQHLSVERQGVCSTSGLMELHCAAEGFTIVAGDEPRSQAPFSETTRARGWQGFSHMSTFTEKKSAPIKSVVSSKAAAQETGQRNKMSVANPRKMKKPPVW